MIDIADELMADIIVAHVKRLPRHEAIAFAERMAERAGVTLISAATAAAIDRLWMTSSGSRLILTS